MSRRFRQRKEFKLIPPCSEIQKESSRKNEINQEVGLLCKSTVSLIFDNIFFKIVLEMMKRFIQAEQKLEEQRKEISSCKDELIAKNVQGKIK